MLKQKIQEDLKNAIRGKKETELLVLRMVLASIHNREIEKKSKPPHLSIGSGGKLKKQPFDKVYPERNRRAQDKPFDKTQGKGKTEDEVIKEGELIDEEIIEVIFSEIKKRKEAISGFEKGEREDLIKKEKAEIEVLERYLPGQLSEEELRKLVKETIKAVGAQEIKDMGKVMTEVMPKIKGKADGGVVSKIVKELLSSKSR